jgi:ribosomal protein L11 methyltransferase
MTATLTPSTHRATFAIGTEQTARRVVDLLNEIFLEGQAAIAAFERPDGRWDVSVHFAEPPDQTSIRELVGMAAGDEVAQGIAFDTVEARDWVKATLEELVPVRAGRIIVHGQHDRLSIPPNKLGIEIEAALAFGTGHHGTTRGCLLAIDRLCKSIGRPTPHLRILDLGTGSGVLAIAAARALRQRVLATDLDAAAVRVARDNMRLNGVGGLVELVTANGLTAPAIRARAPFDLIFANILLGPLQRLASPLAKIVAPGGHVVLSGLLNAQANAALAAYHALTLERRIEIDGWTTLLLKRPLRRRSGVAPHGTGS